MAYSDDINQFFTDIGAASPTSHLRVTENLVVGSLSTSTLPNGEIRTEYFDGQEWRPLNLTPNNIETVEVWGFEDQIKDQTKIIEALLLRVEELERRLDKFDPPTPVIDTPRLMRFE